MRHEGAVDDKRTSAFGIGCSKQHAHGSTFRDAHERGAFRPCRFHYRANIVHALFQCGYACHAVRHARPTFVKVDDARECRESLHPAHKGWLFPQDFHVRDRTRCDNQVNWSTTKDLIGNAQIAAACISGFRLHSNQMNRSLRGQVARLYCSRPLYDGSGWVTREWSNHRAARVTMRPDTAICPAYPSAVQR